MEDLPGTDWQENTDLETELHIDVRGLQPPEPMLAILGRIEQLWRSGAIIIHHDRDPVYLYPELAERGWTYRRLPSPKGEIRLRLEKTP